MCCAITSSLLFFKTRGLVAHRAVAIWSFDWNVAFRACELAIAQEVIRHKVLMRPISGSTPRLFETLPIDKPFMMSLVAQSHFNTVLFLGSTHPRFET